MQLINVHFSGSTIFGPHCALVGVSYPIIPADVSNIVRAARFTSAGGRPVIVFSVKKKKKGDLIKLTTMIDKKRKL